MIFLPCLEKLCNKSDPSWKFSSSLRLLLQNLERIMKKVITLLATATFFALVCSLIDQFVWNNDFYWINVAIGFIAGAALVLLGSPSNTKKTV